MLSKPAASLSALAAALVSTVAVAGCSAGTAPAPTPTPTVSAERAQPDAPNWGAPANQAALIRKAGLVSDSMEHFEVHVHDHLDVIVNGQNIPVPANLGIDGRERIVAELHTHDTDGIIHVESNDPNYKFTLGQLMTLWNIPLTQTQFNTLHTDSVNSLGVYVDGVKQTGDPADVPITGGQEIAIVYGPEGAVPIPSTYDFKE